MDTWRTQHRPVEISSIEENVDMIVDGQVGNGFLESADFNLEYWRGHRDLGQYSVAVQLF